MTERDDPLVQALPPATDYLTYLTLLEYQLTPARLPTLHALLQDERLTTNIGWDLVQLLLPMLPASSECLQDIARLGNPREVILRVSEALMQLHPEEEEEEEEDDDKDEKEGEKSLPQHVVQFNCLVAMLSVLHRRIQTKSPSRFIATSLQAALEAYTAMPTSETTIALLEFFRDVAPSKRPAPPPRAASESSVLRVSEASAPDPEAEATTATAAPSATDEPALTRRFLQFGLIELLKSYLLSLAGPTDPGMSWAIRLQEKLHPELLLPERPSQIETYANTKRLGERDMLMAKITALSQDLGLSDQQLVEIVSQPSDSHPPPLDFDEPPKNPDDILLERHGSLLLLAARAAMAELFSSRQVTPMAVFPDLSRLFSNFVGGFQTPDEVALGQPPPLLDSLLTLTVFAMKSIGRPSNDAEFHRFVLELAACTARQNYTSVRRIPSAIVHSHPSELVRFKLIRRVLEDDTLQGVKESAVGWLKDETLASQNTPASPFQDPSYFSVLFPSLFNSTHLFLDVSSSGIVSSWLTFSQTLAPAIHAALSLYYLLLSSSDLRARLRLNTSYPSFRAGFQEPLRSICRAFEADVTDQGGDGLIQKAVGEDMSVVGNALCGFTLITLDQVEDAASEAFADLELREYKPTQEDLARVEAAREATCTD